MILHILSICTPMQLEQELELVLGKQALLRSFSAEWGQKWVPAIISYSRKLKRRDIQSTLKDMEKGGLKQ